MKKISKILLIVISVFLAICQIQNTVCAYTLDEVKEITKFKIIEDNTNVDFDIMVYGSELNGKVKIPCIQTNIEDVLYSKDNLLDIDFFGIYNKQKDNSSSYVSNLVKIFFKVFLYISMVVMMTLLIYMGVNLVFSSTFPKKSFIPLGKVFGEKKEKSVDEYKRGKNLVELWLVSFLVLILIIYVINLIIAFSYKIIDLTEGGSIKDDKIVIYVKDINVEAGSDITSFASGNGTLCCPVNTGNVSSEFGYREPPIEGVSNDHKGIDIAVPEGTEVIAAEDGTVITSGWSDSAGYWVEIDHGNKFVTKYMHNKEDGLLVKVGDKVKKGQTIALSGTTGQSTGPHCHFQIEENGEPVNPRNFKYENGPLSENEGLDIDNKRIATSKKKVSFTFETNFEGMLMFFSQRDWDEYVSENLENIFIGWIIILFKWLLYGLFIIRMAVIAILIALSPIVILINAFMRVGGSKGLLGNWFKLYIYMVLLRPIIAIIYFILALSNINIVYEHPFYLLIVIFTIILFVLLSLIKLIKGFKQNNNKNIIRKNM